MMKGFCGMYLARLTSPSWLICCTTCTCHSIIAPAPSSPSLLLLITVFFLIDARWCSNFCITQTRQMRLTAIVETWCSLNPIPQVPIQRRGHILMREYKLVLSALEKRSRKKRWIQKTRGRHSCYKIRVSLENANILIHTFPLEQPKPPMSPRSSSYCRASFSESSKGNCTCASIR